MSRIGFWMNALLLLLFDSIDVWEAHPQNPQSSLSNEQAVSQLCSSFLWHLINEINRNVLNRCLSRDHGVDGSDNFVVLSSSLGAGIHQTLPGQQMSGRKLVLKKQPQETKQVWRWSHFILTGTKLQRDRSRNRRYKMSAVEINTYLEVRLIQWSVELNSCPKPCKLIAVWKFLKCFIDMKHGF